MLQMPHCCANTAGNYTDNRNVMFVIILEYYRVHYPHKDCFDSKMILLKWYPFVSIDIGIAPVTCS